MLTTRTLTGIVLLSVFLFFPGRNKTLDCEILGCTRRESVVATPNTANGFLNVSPCLLPQLTSKTKDTFGTASINVDELLAEIHTCTRACARKCTKWRSNVELLPWMGPCRRVSWCPITSFVSISWTSVHKHLRPRWITYMADYLEALYFNEVNGTKVYVHTQVAKKMIELSWSEPWKVN